MVEERQSPPVVRVGTQSDRPSESSHYEALERARDPRRRFSRRRPFRPANASPAPSSAPSDRSPDRIRGTRIDVVA